MSNLCPDTRGQGGHLFRLTCSVVLRGGRDTANRTHWCVWECLQLLGHTGFAPAHGVCAFLVYTAQGPGYSAGELSKAGPGLRALPRSKLLRFRFSGIPQRHRLSWACVLCPSQVRTAQMTRCLVSTLSQVYNVSYHLPGPSCLVSWLHHESAVSGVPCVSSGELILGCEPFGRYPPCRRLGRLS